MIGMGSLAFFALVKFESYRMSRLLVFLHPELDPRGIGYQINQALLAIGSGGIFGLGLGHSRQKFNYLPEPVGDSIFAIISEEIGLIGAAVLDRSFCDFCHARAQDRQKRAGYFRQTGRGRHHFLDNFSGAYEYRRDYRTYSAHGSHFALHQLWRNIACVFDDWSGNFVEYIQKM